MIQWGVIIGALLGWMAGDYDLSGFVLGGIAGAIAGMALRSAVRAEIRRHTAPLEAALARVAEETAPSAAPLLPSQAMEPPPAVSPDTPSHAEAPPAPTDLSDLAAPRPPQPDPAPPRQPAEPTVIDHAIAAARGWLFGGNTIVRAGLVILFVGLSFLARWAAGAGLFPIELRLALVAIAGIAILVVGWTRRDARPAFALALQGAGVAILYLTAFAGAQFGVLPLAAAFAIMIVVAALGCALALLQNAEGLAAAAFAGGYAVPLLIGRDSGPPLALFAYYTLLNLAVLLIAWRRSWRSINLVGFFATFGVATIWGLLSYGPADYAAAQAFLILSVLIYVAAAVLYARNTPGRFGRVVDGTLLFGPAIAGFGLQVGLVGHLPYGPAFAALGFAALYILLAAAIARRDRAQARLLIETLIAIGVGFVTLAVPLALGARWTGPAWAVEGAGAFWLGMRQGRWLPRLFGLGLLAVAASTLLASLPPPALGVPLISGPFLSVMLVALPLLAVAWWMRRRLPPGETRLAAAYARVEGQLGAPIFLAGFVLWCIAFLLEINRPPIGESGFIAPPNLLSMLAIVASAALSAVIGRRLGWPVALWPGRASLFILAAGLIGQVLAGGRVFDTPAWAIWLVAIVLHLDLLRRDERLPRGAARVIHAGGVWLGTALLADGLWFAIDRAELWGSSWAGVTMLASGTAVLLMLVAWAGRAARAESRIALPWPIAQWGEAYYWLGALPVAVLVYGGALATTLIASGAADPLPYVPLINPVDLAVALAIVALVRWRRLILTADPRPQGAHRLAGRQAVAALAGLAFVAINMLWLRTAHHYLGVGWDGDALLGSYVVQTGLAILWTVLALGLMVAAHRRGMRPMWLAGAALLGLVVAKLALVDLSNAEGGERIVTFIVVGVLMLVVGYFAPLPPRTAEQKETA